MGGWCGGQQHGADAVLHRVSEDQWPIRRVDERMSPFLYEFERATEAGCTGDDVVVGGGGSLALRAHELCAEGRRECGNYWG